VHIILIFRPRKGLLNFLSRTKTNGFMYRYALRGRAPLLVLALPVLLFVANTPALAPLLELPPRIDHGLVVVSALELSPFGPKPESHLKT
jgi:hypothetical protein